MPVPLSDQGCHSFPHMHCANCRLSPLCLPTNLAFGEINQLEEIIQRGRPLHKSENIYCAGEEFQSVYVVRSGAIKTVSVSQNGTEQITGFYLPGELVGVDGLASNLHTNSATALETSAVCEIPFAQLETLSSRVPNLQRRFFQLMSREITNEQKLITLLGKNSADERISALLLSISQRNESRGLAAHEFYLPMTRADMGNYLGLTIETVSRVMGRMHKRGIIALDKKHVRILQMEQLRNTAQPETH